MVISLPVTHCLQVEADESKTVSSSCDLKDSQNESVSTHTCGDASAGRTSSDEAENKAEVKRPQTDAQVPTKPPSENSRSGEPVSASASKREESPQKSCAEEKRDKSKEEPHGGNQEEGAEGQFRALVGFLSMFLSHNWFMFFLMNDVRAGPEPMVNLTFVKNDSYEKGTDLMVVNVYMKGICRETSRVLFREQDFTLIFQTRLESQLGV